jgi:hypothetical protein
VDATAASEAKLTFLASASKARQATFAAVTTEAGRHRSIDSTVM